MPTMPNQYYSRFDSARQYDQHLFIAGRGLQSAELNEIQQQAAYRSKGIADALFKDGDIIRDARCVVVEATGATSCEAGAIYLRGAVRGVSPATFIIPMGTVTIGVYLVEDVVTALQDPALRDPATGTRNYGEEGAERLRITPVWGYAGDGKTGEFFAVYGVTDRVLDAKEAPPNLDAFTQSLARYDRDSTGGSYVVDGMTVTKLDNTAGGRQAYSVLNGRARVNGYGIEFQTSRRVVIDNDPDLRPINNEPHLSSTIGSQRVVIDRPPMLSPTSVSITSEKTVSITHGVVTGAQDTLPDTSVLSLVEVKQGATTFVSGTDYNLTAGKVDWSPAGNEPAPGSTYTVKYQFITLVTTTLVDERGFTVTGAVTGSLILVTYNQMLPRIDRVCVTSEGTIDVIRGVAADYVPKAPIVPSDMLPLASIYQTWTSSRAVVNDSIRMVPMTTLAGVQSKIDHALYLIAQQRLESNIHTRESGTKKGLFTDPFTDDSQRDAGLAQNAAIFSGMLTLPVDVTVSQMGVDIQTPQSCVQTTRDALSQLAISGNMKINPYMSFAHIYTPSVVTLSPAVDRWVQDDGTVEMSGVLTRAVTTGVTIDGVSVAIDGNTWIQWWDASVVSPTGQTITSDIGVETTSRQALIQNLREIEVRVEATNFGPGEIVASVTFDGISVELLPI